MAGMKIKKNRSPLWHCHTHTHTYATKRTLNCNLFARFIIKQLRPAFNSIGVGLVGNCFECSAKGKKNNRFIEKSSLS